MVICCSAPGCTSKKDSNSKVAVQFHKFPLRKPDILAKWVKAMKCPSFKPNAMSYLCSSHFANADYDSKSSGGTKHLKPNAVPSYFEKKRPGRKKKIISEHNSVQDIKAEEFDGDTNKESEKVYPQVETDANVESNLAEIIGDREKGTLQVLIVGEDGKITNSEYIFKKETLSDDEFREEADLITEVQNEIDNENCKRCGEDNDKNSETYSLSEQIQFNTHYNDSKGGETKKKLKSNLNSAKRKIKFLQMQCKKLNKQNKELKFLLKLLVLKRGRGERNLEQLLEEYERYDYDQRNIKVKEEFYIEN